MELRGKNKHRPLSSFWIRASQTTPAPCPECRSALCPRTQPGKLRGRRQGPTSHQAWGSASTAQPPSAARFVAKKRGHCLSDTAAASSAPACTQPCCCTHQHRFSGAGLALHAASWEPCTPEANPEPSRRSAQRASPQGWCLQPHGWKPTL